MRQSKFKIENREIDFIETVSMAGNANVDTFLFEFDNEWEGLTKTLVLQNGSQPVLVNLINDEAIIPASVYHDGILTFGVYGRNENDEIVLSSLMYTLEISDGAYNYSGNPSNLPDKSTWDQYTDIMLGLVGQGEITLENCQSVLSDMQTYCIDKKAEMEGIRDTTEGYKNDAQDILEDVQDIKQDIIDMGSSRTFATFYLDATTGDLYVINSESLGNMGFFVQDGDLYVNINSEVNN